MIEQNSWGSYPKLYALGHKALSTLLLDSVVVEEKIDGSQFSFGVIDGVLRCRSRNVELDLDGDNHMFTQAVLAAKDLAPRLHPGWTYRAEYVMKPKHNSLLYDRVPAYNLMLFDINNGYQSYLSADDKALEAFRLGLETVPLLYEGRITSMGQLQGFLENHKSVLGAAFPEGIVVKNYNRYGVDGKALMGKYVSEKFKEVHQVEWKKSNPKSGDILTTLAAAYATEQRWDKAVQHLRDRGELEDDPRDIGALLKEVQTDLLEECEDEIKEVLFKWAWKHLARASTNGFAQWYKQRLLSQQVVPDE